MILGIDTSNYTGLLTAAQCNELRANGIQRAIVGCQFPDFYQEQVQQLQAAGIACEAYIYLYNSKGQFARQAWEACQTVNSSTLVTPRLWLDVEDVTLPFVADIEADIIDSIHTVRMSNLTPGIYTGAWFWEKYLPKFTPGPGVRLWDANYDDNPSDFSVSYGGWYYSSVKQYRGDATIGPVSGIDLDSWSD